MEYHDTALAADCYRMLAETTPQMIVVHTLSGDITYINPATSVETGYSPDELRGADVSTVFSAETASAYRRLFETASAETPAASRPALTDGIWKTKSGRLFPVEMHATLGPAREPSCTALLHARNISARISAANRYSMALKQTNRRLKDLHHRVKNSFQILISLLDLDRMRVSDPETGSMLSEIQGRLYTMSLIHSQMDSDIHSGRIPMGEHLCDIMNFLSDLYDPLHETAVDMNIQEVLLPVAQAVPCALLLTQLIAAAFKSHAAAKTNNPRIEASIGMSKNEFVNVKVTDNASFTADIDGPEFRLFDNIVRKQLHGKWHLDEKNGTATIYFKRAC